MEFLKKHYEKLVLCVVLLGLAGAVLWGKSALEQAQIDATPPPKPVPPKSSQVAPIDLTEDQKSLAQITNPPPVVLSGEHNTVNPVTWKRKPNGDLLKIILTGADALVVTKITPLFDTIAYLNEEDGPVYVMAYQEGVDLSLPNQNPKTAYARKGEKNNKWPFRVIGIKGADNDPSEINCEIKSTGNTNVWVSKNAPYKQVGSYLVDLKYDPESQTLSKKKVNDEITLDKELYKIVAITNDAVRVQTERTSKVTEIKLSK